MQTIDDLRIGSLVRWFGADGSDNKEDVDDVGIVTEVHRDDYYDDDGISIYWSMTDKINFFNVSEINACFYENQLEVISSANPS